MDKPPVFVVGGIKTLPIYVAIAQTQEDIPQFGKGKALIKPVEPDYPESPYTATVNWLEIIGRLPDVARTIVSNWNGHFTQFLYFVQLKDDKDHRRIKALHAHTELVSTLCDARLGMDPSILWAKFDELHCFESVHSDYRADGDREAKYDEYVKRLDGSWQRLSAKAFEAIRLTQRIERQIELKAAQWATLPPLKLQPTPTAPPFAQPIFQHVENQHVERQEVHHFHQTNNNVGDVNNTIQPGE